MSNFGEPNIPPGALGMEYMAGTGPGQFGLSSSIAPKPGVNQVASGQNAGANVNVANSGGTASVNWYLPIVTTLPTAGLPTTNGQGVLVFLVGTGLQLYDPSTQTWSSV